MTYKPTHSYGDVPEYPTSSMVPREFWRKEVDADPDYKQVVTIDKGPGVPPVRHEVEPGWNKPITFESDEGDQ